MTMTAPESSRKRKATTQNNGFQAAMKRLRQARLGLEEPISGPSSTPQRKRATRQKNASNSSTPNASQTRLSPMAASSVAGEAEEDESGDSLSDAPSSLLDLDIRDADQVGLPALEPARASAQTSVQTLRTRYSEQWRNATRAGAAVRTAPSHSGMVIAKMPVRDPDEKKNTAKPFLDLPRELRDQIYRELYVHTGAISIRQEKFHLPVLAHPRMPLALCRTNRQIYEEVMKIYVSENDFILAQNILSAIDFLGAMPPALSQHFTSITLGRTIMSGYVRYELGMFDSSRLRADLVKKLVYDWNLNTISIEVPDEHNPNAPTNGVITNPANGNAGAWFNLSTFHPRHDYSWSLMREIIDVLLESGFETLRLVYSTPLPYAMTSDPKKLLGLYAISRILYLDDEFEVETQVKRIEAARAAGRRTEFENKAAVERHVRARRHVRSFCIGLGKRKHWETGSVVIIKRVKSGRGGGNDGLWDVGELMKMPGAMESLNRDL